MEGHARSLAEDLLELRGVLKPGHLHQNTLAALRLDGGLGRAERVEAPVEHLHALRHRGAHALFDTVVGERSGNAVAVLRKRHFAHRPLPEEARLHWRRERLQRGERLLGVCGVAQREGDPLAARVESAIADALIAQCLPDVAFESLQPVLDQAGAIHFKQEMGAAAQIEPEHDLPLRQKGRP